MSGCVKSHRAIRTFCWLPPDRFCINSFMLGVLVCMLSLDSFAALKRLPSCKTPCFAKFLCAAITVLSSIDRMPNTPLWRRSSVRSANPCAFASRTDFTLNGLPSFSILPDSIARRPNKASTISVRCAPTRPPMPKISPLCSSNDTCWNDFGSGEHRSSTLSTTSFPGVYVFGGKRFVISRPTMRLIIRSVVNSLAGQVPT